MKLDEIIKYVTENYDKLPESKMNEKRLIIVWGKDESASYEVSFEGIGIDKEGKLFWCYASGCSCSGVCEATEKTLKVFELENADAFTGFLKLWENGIPKIESYEESDY